MGVPLNYVTTTPVASTLKDRLRAEADAVNASREWICESIVFYEVDEHMRGDTKLFTPDPADASRAGEDAKVIVDLLARWSREHDLTWSLDMAGADIGKIANGEADATVMNTVEALLSLAGMDLADPSAFFDDDADEPPTARPKQTKKKKKAGKKKPAPKKAVKKKAAKKKPAPKKAGKKKAGKKKVGKKKGR